MSLELTQLNSTQKEDLRMALGLGTAATADAGLFATAEQGAKADDAVLFVSVPSSMTDFSMFAGGVAPASGAYAARDARYEYSFVGGDTEWRRDGMAKWT